MKINNPSSGDDTPSTRSTDRRFTVVLKGDEKAKDNYRLIYAQQEGAFSGPRHRHNFDQVRFCLRGAQNYGPNCWIGPGEVAYYPEGAYYGPEVTDKECVTMTLQFGGPSGLGFVSSERIAEGMEQLKALGTFDKGIFRRSGELEQGKKRNQDAFEAVWEHLNGKRLEYPVPRYPVPILIQPDAFPWRALGKDSGVSMKNLGVFTERSVELSMYKIEPGVDFRIPPRAGTQIGIVSTGEGQIAGKPFAENSAFSLEPNELVSIRCQTEAIFLLVGLSLFEERAVAA
jgi:hypothetical protein